jgi:capsule polysaccharide export protein KpsE/RkpR
LVPCVSESIVETVCFMYSHYQVHISDNHSSAHVYLRLKPEDDITQIPANIIEDMAQLTKENSIEGKKMPSVRVIYTFASNLKKTGDMDVGAVSFHDRSKVYTTNVAKRNREIVCDS